MAICRLPTIANKAGKTNVAWHRRQCPHSRQSFFRKFGFLPMKRQIAAVIAPQNCYLLRNIR